MLHMDMQRSGGYCIWDNDEGLFKLNSFSVDLVHVLSEVPSEVVEFCMIEILIFASMGGSCCFLFYLGRRGFQGVNFASFHL